MMGTETTPQIIGTALTPARPLMTDPEAVIDLTFTAPASCTHLCPHFPYINLEVFPYFGDSLCDFSPLSVQCWPHRNKFHSCFTTTHFSAFGFCQW